MTYLGGERREFATNVLPARVYNTEESIERTVHQMYAERNVTSVMGLEFAHWPIQM